MISCTAAGYIGSFTYSVANPAIATVELAPGTSTLFYVTGVAVGTTTLSLESDSGGIGKDVINVVPN